MSEPRPIDREPGPPAYANGYTIFAGGPEVQLQLYYQAPGDTTTPRRVVARAAMHADLFVRLVEGFVGALDPIGSKAIVERLTRAIGAKLPPEAEVDDGPGGDN